MRDGKTLGHVLAAQGHIPSLNTFVKAGGNLCVRDHAGMLPIDYLTLPEDPTNGLYCLGAYLMQRLNQEGAKTKLTDEEWGYFEDVSGSLPAETKKRLGDIPWIKKNLLLGFPIALLEDAIDFSMNRHDAAKVNTLAILSMLIQRFGSAWKDGQKALKKCRYKVNRDHEKHLLRQMRRAATKSCIWAISLLASEAMDGVEAQKAEADLRDSLVAFLSTLSTPELLKITHSSRLTSTRVRKHLFKLIAPGKLASCQHSDSYSVQSFEHYECEIVNQAVLVKGWQSLVLTPEEGWENATREKKDKNAVFGSVLAHAIDRLDAEVVEKRDLRQVYSYLCAVRQVTEMIRGNRDAVAFGSSRMWERKKDVNITPIEGPYGDYFFQKVLKTLDREVSADFFASLSLPNGGSLKLARVLFDTETKFIVHPRADQTMEILFDDAQADFAELMEGGLDEEEFWEKLAKVYWNLVQGMPCSRGNASICLALCSLVWRANGIEPPCLKPGIIPDLEVLLAYPCRDSFIPKFKDLFDASVDG